MNTGPAFRIWLQLFGALAVEASLIFLVAFGLQQWARTGVWRRTIWQVALAGVGLVALLELTGLSRAAIGWTAPKVKLQRPLPLLETSKNLPIPLAPVTETAPVGEPVAPVQDAFASPASYQSARLRFGWWPGIIWLAGFALVIGHAGLARLIFSICSRRKQMAVDAALSGQVQFLARLLGLRRAPRVTCFKEITGPIAFGIFRPTIGLPEQFCRFTPEQREAMIVHELAHLAARDPLWYLLADLVTALCWWHPLVWWSRRQFRLASETAADEASLLVPNGPDALAECLVEFGRLLAPRKEFGWLRIQGDGFRSGLGRRVERLLQLTGQSWRPANRFGGWLARAVGPAILAVAAISGTALAWPNHDAEAKTVAQSWKGSVAGVALDTLGTGIEKPTVEPAKLQIIARDAIPDLVRDAKLFLDADKLDQAEALLDEILSEEPTNKLAVDYWNLAQEKRKAKPREAAAISPSTNWPLSQFRAILPMNHDQPGTNPSDPKRQGTDHDTDQALGKTPRADTTPARLSESRHKMYSKLDQIVLREVAFDGLPLSEVVKALSTEARKLDPEKRGINFLVSASANAAAENGDVGSTLITIAPPLRNKTLHQIIDAVVMVAGRPIKYSVEDYAVVLSAKARDNPPLHTRWFKVDPETVIEGFQRTSGDTYDIATADSVIRGRSVPEQNTRPSSRSFSVPGSAAEEMNIIALNEKLVRDFFRDFYLHTGVNLDPPKSVFFNVRLGQLMVRATLEDLELIEKAVQAININASQVTIEFRICEISQDDFSSLGLNWILGATSLINSSVATSSGILTDFQFRTVAKALELRTGGGKLTKVITPAGRTAHVEGMTMTNLSAVDVVPYVLADGYTIQMAVTSKFNEFVGYDLDEPRITWISDGPYATPDPNGAPRTRTKPLPVFRLHPIVAKPVVWDGQTFVLSVDVPVEPGSATDKLLTLGDLPLAGRFFRNDSAKKKKIVIFITPTVVDPTGNRLNRGVGIPFPTDKIRRNR